MRGVAVSKGITKRPRGGFAAGAGAAAQGGGLGTGTWWDAMLVQWNFGRGARESHGFKTEQAELKSKVTTYMLLL